MAAKELRFNEQARKSLQAVLDELNPASGKVEPENAKKAAKAKKRQKRKQDAPAT